MEDNKDLMKVNEEIEDTDEEFEETPERSGIGTGWAMLIGSGLTLAAIAAGKKAKKMWMDRKARQKQTEGNPIIIETDFEPVEEPKEPEAPEEEPKKKEKKK